MTNTFEKLKESTSDPHIKLMLSSVNKAVGTNCHVRATMRWLSQEQPQILIELAALGFHDAKNELEFKLGNADDPCRHDD